MVRSHYRPPFSMPDFIYTIIFSVLMLIGIIAEAITLPGLPLMFVLALIFGFIDNFQHITTINLTILGTIAFLSVLANYLSGFYGAKIFGAKKQALIAGIVGFVAGLILFPPLGGFIGMFLGIFIIELVHLPNFFEAFKKASGSLLGSIIGVIINVILAILFLVLFVIFAL